MITAHFIQRAAERKGLSMGEAMDFESRAHAKGKRADQMPKKEKMYMKLRESLDNVRTVYYDDCILLFTRDWICLTMYAAPEWFMKREHHCEYKKTPRYD